MRLPGMLLFPLVFVERFAIVVAVVAVTVAGVIVVVAVVVVVVVVVVAFADFFFHMNLVRFFSILFRFKWVFVQCVHIGAHKHTQNYTSNSQTCVR